MLRWSHDDMVVVVVVVVVVVGLVVARPLYRLYVRGRQEAERYAATALTRTYRGEYRSGLIGVLAGDSLARSVDRLLADVAADGRRVMYMVPNRWSIGRYVGVLLGTILTLGLWSRAPGYLVVAERCLDAAANAEAAAQHR